MEETAPDNKPGKVFMRLRRLHWADKAGVILAGLLIIGGLIALRDPQDMVIVHTTGDMRGGQGASVIEIARPATVRFYGITALSLGMGLAVFMVWALQTTDDNAST